MVLAHVRDIAVDRIRWRIRRALSGNHNHCHTGLSIITDALTCPIDIAAP